MHIEDFTLTIEQVRKTKPLVHHITNYVTVNDCANITLALGASPIMADAIEEAAEIAAISSALVLNMGTLNARTVDAMLAAGKSANAAGVPVVFDPVGAGASAFRNETARRILAEVKLAVLRGNVSEAGFIAGLGATARGVDAGAGGAGDTVSLAKDLAKKLRCVVAVTGKTDVVSDGTRAVAVENGVEMLAELTGTGCMLSSLLGAFAGANREKLFEAVAAGVMTMGIAGEIAFENAGHKGNGSFRAALHDAVSRMNAGVLEKRAKIREKD